MFNNNKLLTSTLKSLVILFTYWLSLVRVFNESHHFFLLITFFSSQQDRFAKSQQPIKCQGLFKGTNHIAGK